MAIFFCLDFIFVLTGLCVLLFDWTGVLLVSACGVDVLLDSVDVPVAAGFPDEVDLAGDTSLSADDFAFLTAVPPDRS